MKLRSEILNREFEVTITHLCLQSNDDFWVHDKWSVYIEHEHFEYSTGIGHRVAKHARKSPRTGKWFNPVGYGTGQAARDFERMKNMRIKETVENYRSFMDRLSEVSKPVPPSIDDILYSLVLDAESGSYSFKDWCDNFGYDEDSLKALDIYRACQKISKKVRKFIPDISAASEAFQDY